MKVHDMVADMGISAGIWPHKAIRQRYRAPVYVCEARAGEYGCALLSELLPVFYRRGQGGPVPVFYCRGATLAAPCLSLSTVPALTSRALPGGQSTVTGTVWTFPVCLLRAL